MPGTMLIAENTKSIMKRLQFNKKETNAVGSTCLYSKALCQTMTMDMFLNFSIPQFLNYQVGIYLTHHLL